MTVTPTGKRGPVKSDYQRAAKQFVDASGMKYKADSIIESYGILPVRLPPYHPELNPIGNIFPKKI